MELCTHECYDTIAVDSDVSPLACIAATCDHLHNRDLSRNRFSGTMGPFVPSMQTLIVSNNRLSGFLPPLAPALENLLLNNMRLSGTVPVGRNSSLQTFSVARNYLDGPTDSLSMAHSLRTLIISGNRFSVSVHTTSGNHFSVSS